MEACIAICSINKPKERKNKVLFINAVNEVARESAQSFLTAHHIQRIVATYQTFGDKEGFARVVSNNEIRDNGCNLSIPLYVRTNDGNSSGSETEALNIKQTITSWQESSMNLKESMKELLSILCVDM